MREEKIVVGAGTEFPLNGLLTLPDCEGPVPAVVMVHGSGSSNMDEKVFKLTPFKDLAHGLAEHGIASLRYDKRSFAHGRKMVKGMITVREETIEDAVLAVQLLKQDPRVDPKRIYLLGHSMGAMLAPRIDAEGADCAGLVLMAGTLRTLDEVMKWQLEANLACMSKPLRLLARKPVEKILKKFDGMYERTDEQAKQIKIAGGTTLYYFKEMGEHPAADYLTKTEKPVLILQGERDLQVTASEDFEGYKRLLEGRENVTFRLYEGLNHAFVPAMYDSISKVTKEFTVARPMEPRVIDDIANWILQ